MERDYIEPRYSSLTYQLKEGTKASYYLREGKEGILPNRIGIGIFTWDNTSALHKKRVFELKASYTKKEGGKYKGLNKGDTIHTSIYPLQLGQDFTGYGVLDERHKIYDLLVFQNKESNKIIIHHFEGMAKPEFQGLVWNYLKEITKK